MHRLKYMALVLAVLLSSIVGATSGPVGTTLNTSDVHDLRHLQTNKRSDARDKQALESGTTQDEREEERFVTLPATFKWIMSLISDFNAWRERRRVVRALILEKKTPEDVFKMLGLDKSLEALLENPSLQIWSYFMVAYNKQRKASITMLGTLTKVFGNEAVAKALEVARRNPKTHRLASRLQSDQLYAWMLNGLDDDHIFSLLKLGEVPVEKLVLNPNFSVWLSYYCQMHAYNPKGRLLLIDKLQAVFGDVELAKAFEAATKIVTTDLAKGVIPIEDIAKKLQVLQFQKWATDKIPPLTILKKLQMSIFTWKEDPNAAIVIKYLQY